MAGCVAPHELVQGHTRRKKLIFSSRRNSEREDGCAAGPDDRLSGVHHNRRGELIGRKSSFHVYGSSRPEAAGR